MKTQEATRSGKGKGVSQKRQFVNFIFFRLDPMFRRLASKEKQEALAGAKEALNRYREEVMTYSYSLMGLRAECDFMLWRISFHLSSLEAQASALYQTKLGGYLTPRYSFLSQTRRSVYVDKMHPGHQEERLRVVPGSGRFLFVYPFVKKRNWYRLPLEERQRMMEEHIAIGAKYGSVKLHTTYSFGFDDQEFVVAFETDEPSDFLDLVMELREAEGSLYTERDTPIFTCLAKSWEELAAGF